MRGHSWSVEEDNRLKTMTADNFSYSQMGTELSTSRFAIAGRIFRLRARNEMPPAKPQPERKAKTVPLHIEPRNEAIKPPQPMRVIPMLPDSLNLPLHALKADQSQCRFVTAEGPQYRFCALPTDGCSYCATHAKIVYVVRPQSKTAPFAFRR